MNPDDLPPDPPPISKLRMTWAGPLPALGDWLVPSGARSRTCYRVVSITATRNPQIYLMRCHRFPRAELPSSLDGARAYAMTWNRPRRRPLTRR